MKKSEEKYLEKNNIRIELLSSSYGGVLIFVDSSCPLGALTESLVHLSSLFHVRYDLFRGKYLVKNIVNGINV